MPAVYYGLIYYALNMRFYFYKDFSVAEQIKILSQGIVFIFIISGPTIKLYQVFWFQCTAVFIVP